MGDAAERAFLEWKEIASTLHSEYTLGDPKQNPDGTISGTWQYLLMTPLEGWGTPELLDIIQPQPTSVSASRARLAQSSPQQRPIDKLRTFNLRWTPSTGFELIDPKTEQPNTNLNHILQGKHLEEGLMEVYKFLLKGYLKPGK